MSLNRLLTRLIWLCVGPLVLLAAYLAISSVMTHQAERDLAAANLAESLAVVIDQRLNARIGALQLLAESSLLDDASRLKELYREAQGYYRGFETHVVLADREMRMLFNTRVPFGTELPPLPRPKGRAAAPAALETGKPAVGDIFPGPIAKEPLVAIVVPAVREGKTRFLLITTLETQRLRRRLDMVDLPVGWSLTLLDGNNEVIARRAPPDVNPATDVDESGRFAVKSAISPWSVVVEIPRGLYRKPLIEAAVALALVILGITLLSIIGGTLAGGRIGRAVASLAQPSALGIPPPDIVEIAAVRRLLDESARRRETAEAALRESEWRFRATFELAAVGVTQVAPDGHWLLVNQKMCDIIGYSREELLSRTFQAITHPDDLEADLVRLRKLLAGEIDTYSTEKRYIRKDGSPVWVKLTVALVRKPDGTPDYSISIVEDIQAAKEAEAALKKNAAVLQTAQRLAGIGNWEWDVRTGVHAWSEETYRIYGRDPALPPAAYPDVQRYFTPETWACLSAAVEKGLAEGSPYECDAEVVRPDGTRRWIVARGEATRDAEGNVTGLHGTIQDITERKRAEEEKAKLLEQLLQAQKMESVGRLAGGVAHDFNNMLTVILGHAVMVMDKIDPTQLLHANMQEIKKAAERSAQLTRQLLAFARKQTIAPKVLDLNATIEGTLKMLQRLIGEDIHLVWLPHADLWPVTMDPSQIDQILANLCVNARDAIAGVGNVTIETDNVHLDEAFCADHAGCVPGDYVLLAVSDDGCGMDKETLGKLFEPFFTTKEVGRGTGLGLATIYGIVKQNNGFIDVGSEPGRGTTFRIYLPRRTDETEPVRSESALSALEGHETVLVVEDEPEILHLSQLMLERHGYHVLTAGSPGEALRVAREYAKPIHLLLTDVVMPEMNGRELAQEMLSLHPDLKCLFTSGYTADVIAHHGVLDKGMHFIQKPFSRNALALKVREVLEKP